jgi:GT2 family glycosyltransferase
LQELSGFSALKNNPSYINKYESMFAIRQDRFSQLNKASTANFFCERSLFDSVGLFDDMQYSGEDHEWNLRAADAGYTLYYDQACVVLHPARNINQIITKTKRLFPNYLRKLTTIRSNPLLFLYGPYL